MVKAALKQNTESNLLNDLIIESIKDKKGKKIIKLDLRNLDDSPTDYFVICEGYSNTHVRAISESIVDKVKHKLKVVPSHVEGLPNSKWILVDYFDTVVHIFYPEAREFYDLENLWSDALSEEFNEL